MIELTRVYPALLLALLVSIALFLLKKLSEEGGFDYESPIKRPVRQLGAYGRAIEELSRVPSDFSSVVEAMGINVLRAEEKTRECSGSHKLGFEGGDTSRMQRFLGQCSMVKEGGPVGKKRFWRLYREYSSIMRGLKHSKKETRI